MRCRFSENSWEYYVFDFGLCVSEICLFFVFILDAIFCGKNFFIFQDSVWLVKRSWWVHCYSNHQLCWIGDRCRSRFALWWFFVRKKLSSQIGSSHYLLVLATECFFSFDIFQNTQRLFWVVNALWVCWQFMGVLSFWFWSLCFWNMSFFVFILNAIFCGTIFFIFQDFVWLVKSSWCVHCCSIHLFYWVSDLCRSGFGLWWFFVRKKLSSQIGSFH